ncbi:AMP-binding protein [Sinorhizobium numidicum]|uniref:AMP-binding protein n=1 Tax=Sinorhizobium numidicum TaxID=680248 RepID=A0ABY8CU32_9HYPH|nr:AMP-binding protein [Sinorhizobium numidicum]WEX74747.1 AMP-binding protein [Sinorhizobium numidicum]WEX80738.1 AMP-binding protein [Sinorhizobium numidicum]
MIRTTTDDRKSREGDLIAIVRDFVREVQPQRADPVEISPSSRIEGELGIDSLGRTELILRIERAFRVRLPAQIVGEADTIGDLINALEHAGVRPGKPDLAQATSSLAPVPAAAEAKTLVEVLDWHVAQHPDRLHLTILQDDTTALGTMTYAELAEAARAVAAGLIRHDVEPGDRVALMLPTSLDFFSAFFGILHAQAVAVPIYPPMRLSRIEDHLRRQAGILRNAGARMLVITAEGRAPATLLRGQVESLSSVESVASLSTEPPTIRLPPVTDARSTALIQYTSGSTGDPKGVVLSHANLLANVRAMGAVMQANSTDVFVSWLPLYHDMGLIGAWLGCLHFGAPLYVMSPMSFLVRPDSWLWAMHRFRATLSASPNFGFEFCLNKTTDADLAGLDLSSLRMVANGAEPVSAQTLHRFVENFERYGFKPGAMAPVYGLAESTVGLAFPPPGRSPVIDRVDRTALTNRGAAMPAGPGDPKPLEIVACGYPLPGHEIRIVDGAGFEPGERQEGRLEFRGPSATSGYFRDDAKTRALFCDGWLDSGDRAYIANGDVYITGRAKDIIIRAGRQIYPQDIEEAVAGIPGVRKGGVVVFGATEKSTGTERVVVVAETRETNETARERLQERAREVATDIAGTPPDDMVLAPPRTVPKTSSGKIRRSAAKQLYESGTIGAPQRSLWWQVLRLSLAGVGPQTRRLRRVVADVLYAGWWWTVIGCGFLLAWLTVMVLPQLTWRWTAARMIARAALAVVGVTITASGIERIPRRNAMLVFNHSSYMDAVVLAAVLPGEPAFVAKREFAGQIFAGPFLRKLGSPFVERYDVAGSLTDAESLTRAARQGRILVFFPEGTFTRRPGLFAFYLGAFRVAADADLPVLPGIIRGTRSMLRGNQWFPRWTSVAIEIAEAVVPSGTNFASVLRLRDAAREAILARCGEPDVGEMVKPMSLAI